MREKNVLSIRNIILSLVTLFMFVSLICLANTAYGDVAPLLSSPAQTDTTVTLSWSKSMVPWSKSYEVTYSTLLDGPYMTVASITDRSTTTFTVTGLQPDTDYYFIVQDKGQYLSSLTIYPSNTLQVKTKPLNSNPIPNPTPASTPTSTPKPIPYDYPTPRPYSYSPTPSSSSTPKPTPTPSTQTPTQTPTQAPTPAPTQTPTQQPSITQTNQPQSSDTGIPTIYLVIIAIVIVAAVVGAVGALALKRKNHQK
jgi:hypothetical protein